MPCLFKLHSNKFIFHCLSVLALIFFLSFHLNFGFLSLSFHLNFGFLPLSFHHNFGFLSLSFHFNFGFLPLFFILTLVFFLFLSILTLASSTDIPLNLLQKCVVHSHTAYTVTNPPPIRWRVFSCIRHTLNPGSTHNIFTYFCSYTRPLRFLRSGEKTAPITAVPLH